MVSFRKPCSDVGCRDHKTLFILQNQIPPHCFEIKFSIHSSEDSLRQFIKPILSLAFRSPDRSTRLSEFFSRSSEIVSRGPPPPAYWRIVSPRPHRIHHYYHQCDRHHYHHHYHHYHQCNCCGKHLLLRKEKELPGTNFMCSNTTACINLIGILYGTIIDSIKYI